MLLSLVVPLVTSQPHLTNLLHSIGVFFNGHENVEVVLINQSGASVYQEALSIAKVHIREIMTSSVIPAAAARNLGAEKSSGEYLFFLDDDAYINFDEGALTALIFRLESGVDAIVCQRGEIYRNEYKSHWGGGIKKITQYNFSNIVIEWNIIIKKSLFLMLGRFPNIGPGSQHAAQCGEAFVLIAKLLNSNNGIELFNSLKVSHPSLLKPKNQMVSLLGYYYGAGYSLGFCLNQFNFLGRFYWLSRFVIAILLDFIYRYKRYQQTVPSKPKRLGFKLAKCRVVGFFDGLFSRKIKDKNWLLYTAE
jgi:glycosyltransferase involved in cell wall biosynthesis